MKNKILIDASHPEETRVAVLQDNTIEDYEFQVKTKEELKGNIYLARVTKVEASLQAAFVDYGGKKQGFLPFNEININYFDLDAEALSAIKDKQQKHKDSLKEKLSQRGSKRRNNNKSAEESGANFAAESDSLTETISAFYIQENGFVAKIIEEEDSALETEEDAHTHEEEEVFDLLDEDFMAQLENENLEYGSRFGYKIQDVIKPDQYLLVQVVKDERGNKGASMTTYLSIAGRYCVLMPSTPFEGGISKKITNYNDRQRLKNIIEGLHIPENTNVIIRTASVERTDEEIINDYNYVDKIWASIQEQTAKMKKPGILFEEGILIKRVIRDIYSSKTEEIIIDGKYAFETAKNFAKLIAPDILKKIIKFNHPKLSLFKYYKIDEQIKSIYSPVVFLKSGGYLVINNTEALTAIDINSGKSKGKRNVEETALRTNLEACSEIAKQVKLRDIGGLIVIDFIDMENSKNRSIIEKKMKDLSKEDKAKIQISPISNFGLLEISRQRIKTSVIERTFTVCPKCQGMGYVRPPELSALHILRSLIGDVENNKIKAPNSNKILIKMPTSEAFYLLNNKRADLSKLEESLKATLRIECDDHLPYPFYFTEEDKSDNEELPETVLFLEKELEINANKQREEGNNQPYNNKKNNHNNKKNHNNKRNNSKFNNKFSGAKVEQKKGFFKKLFGL
ncbi:MAG: Rne/Rng family ribonuclease [Alphaproteobacteria bacterium]|jgi:ribonuclease E|nr:Rne/Rng family ribonuclease [Alphaproteobacteria bacterium]